MVRELFWVSGGEMGEGVQCGFDQGVGRQWGPVLSAVMCSNGHILKPQPELKLELLA